MVEMAAGAADRMVGAQRPDRDPLRCPGLAQIRPRFFREIFRDVHHLLSFHRSNNRLHDLGLAITPFEIAQLNVEVAWLLPPDDRNRLVAGLDFLAMTAGADLGLVFDTLRDGRERAAKAQTKTEPNRDNKSTF